MNGFCELSSSSSDSAPFVNAELTKMEAEANAELLHVRNYWHNVMKPKSPIYTFLLDDIVLTSARKGQIKAQLKVLPVHVNSKGTLHGVVSSCLMDWAGGIAISRQTLVETTVGFQQISIPRMCRLLSRETCLRSRATQARLALLWLSRQFKFDMLGKEAKWSPMAPILNTSKQDEDRGLDITRY